MTVDRRAILSAGLAIGAAAGIAEAAGPRRANTEARPERAARAASLVVEPDGAGDQTARLQAAIDRVAGQGGEVRLAPGRYRVRSLALRPGVWLSGSGNATRLIADPLHSAPVFEATAAHGARLCDFAVEGAPATAGRGIPALIAATDSRDLRLDHLALSAGGGHGLVLRRSGGWVKGCSIRDMGEAAVWSMDASGLAIVDNHIADCANNGVLVWRSSVGEDGTIVTGNRIERIAARGGGSGQNGNGINVFRASGVVVSANRITDCAYSAIRGNAASGIQMVANSCARIGEVALYAEFGFEGAVICSNSVDGAATGISVTNFNEGGRLAVVQGNLIRNLFRREHEPVDKRGEGIAVEADAAVSGNVVEKAPTAGIVIGWGPYMRNVAATGNVIRDAAVGVLISADPSAGAVMVAQNLISGATDGAIRAMDHGRPFGPDLARSGTASPRLAIAGNLVA